MSTQEKKVSLVACIAGLVIGTALAGFVPKFLSEHTAFAAAEQPSAPGPVAIVKCNPITLDFGNIRDSWDCNMIVSPDGYVWFVAVNDNLEDTHSVDNVIKVLWEYQLEKGNL